jgi:hypothetical protein
VFAVDVGIEQEQVAPTDFHAPDFGPDGAAAGVHLHRHRLAVCADGNLHGLLADIGLQIFFLLPAVGIEALAEVTVAVKDADADQWDIQVGGALDVIARENAQATGIDRTRFMQAEFAEK